MRRAFALLALLALMLPLGVSQTLAGKAPAAACWFSPDASLLSASGLPANDTFSLTYSPYPAATHLTTTDGTFSVAVSLLPPLTAYFWQRGGGKSLWKAGPQLNDYHLIATCAA